MPEPVRKMKIEVYENADFISKKTEYTMLFNPEDYSLSWNFTLSSHETAKGGSTTPRLRSIRQSDFKLSFFIDGTGVGAAALGRERVSVNDEVWSFLEAATALNRDGSRKAEQPYCLLVWGDLCRRCQITGVEVNAKLLNRSGQILRAVLNVSFRQVYPAAVRK